MTVINTKEALERFDNDREIYLELIETFLELNDPGFAELRTLIDSGDDVAVMQRMHKLKGGALTLGADGLADAASRLETRLRPDETQTTGDPPGQDAFELLSTVERLYGETIARLTEIRDEMQTRG